MEFQQLRYMVALARNGSFSKASKEMYVSQPALSQQIKKLETELDTILFERMSKGVKLTSAGKQFLPEAIKTLESLRNAKKSVETNDIDQLSGELRIGIIPTIAPYFLPDMMNYFHRTCPDLTLYIEEQQTEDLLNLLKMGKIDHLFISPPIAEGNFEKELIGTEPFYLAVGKNESMASRSRVPITEIDQAPMLLLEEGHCLRDQSVSFCEREDVQPDVVFQGSSLHSILNLVETGFGVTFVPQMVLRSREEKGLQFIPFSKPIPERDLILVRRSSTEIQPSGELFINYVEDWFSDQLGE